MVSFLLLLVKEHKKRQRPRSPARTNRCLSHTAYAQYVHSYICRRCRPTTIMITVEVPYDNPISQDYYDSVVNSLQLHQITCSCGHAACMCIHGYYFRYVCLPEGKLRLRIMRLKCTLCGRTHAILLSSIVPYCRILLCDQVVIIFAWEEGTGMNRICDDNPSVDENNVKAVVRKYLRHWRERLRSESIPLSPVSLLVRKCFSVYLRQFLQIHRTFNCLYPSTT